MSISNDPPVLCFLAALGFHCCVRSFSGCFAQASYCGGLSSFGAQALGAWVQQLWHTGVVALQQAGSSQTRNGMGVPCTGRRILNHRTTRDVRMPSFRAGAVVGLRCELTPRLCLPPAGVSSFCPQDFGESQGSWPLVLTLLRGALMGAGFFLTCGLFWIYYTR